MKTAKATRRKNSRQLSALSRQRKAKAKAKVKAHTKPKVKSKAKQRAKPRARAPRLKPQLKKKPVRAADTPATPSSKKRAAGKVANISDSKQYSQYARQVWVRLASDSKELIRQQAADSGLSPYIAHFAVEAAEGGKTLTATPATEAKDAAIIVRFADAQVKAMVAAMAAQSGVSLSAYAAHFALEAAKAGRVMPEKQLLAASG